MSSVGQHLTMRTSWWIRSVTKKIISKFWFFSRTCFPILCEFHHACVILVNHNYLHHEILIFNEFLSPKYFAHRVINSIQLSLSGASGIGFLFGGVRYNDTLTKGNQYGFSCQDGLQMPHPHTIVILGNFPLPN